jgi:serine/threonine protein kinase
MKTVNLQIAVKEFHHRILVPKKDDSLQGEAPVNEDDFTKEDKILQQIRDVRHRHIIRHFASIDTGKRGYIIFPWADGETLQDYWQTSEGAFCRGRALWSLQQMLGLATALHLLHERFMCRHGDLKPINILCFTECGETVLKIADFGISRIHSKRTIYRKSATTTLGLTPTYQGPEVEFERVSKEEQLPRSRKYDIWSLGCIFLEFSLWLMHGPDAIKGFANARGTSISSTETTLPLYEITNKAAKAAKVHELVSWTIVRLQTDPRCKGDTALAALLSLIKDQMLQPNVESRPSAEDVGKQLEIIVQEAEERHSYLFHPDQGPRVSQLDFERYQPV